MIRTLLFTISILTLFTGDLIAQRFQLSKPSSLRGIAAIDENICWVGGSGSTLAHTSDGGVHWQYVQLVDNDDHEFRDIEVLSKNEIIVMSAGKGDKSKLFKSTDGGGTWAIVHVNPDEEGFYNGIAFWNSDEGVLTGDPVGGSLLVMLTHDGGDTWHKVEDLPAVKEGEYGFAASGSHITVQGSHVWIATGGSVSRVFHSADKGKTWSVSDTPMLQGQPSQGIFSLDIDANGVGLAVGGDYTDENSEAENHVLYTENYGNTWQIAGGPMAYRSAVRIYNGNAIATGPSGTNMSTLDKKTWGELGEEGYHTMEVTNEGILWLAGSDGRIAKINLEQ